MRKRIYIVIPAYNEDRVIVDVIKEIRKTGYRTIIVVDDGSSDNTFLKAKKAKAIALRHIINRGKGATVKTGIEAAKLLNADITVTIDGDGQHDPTDITKMIKKLDTYDIVLGSRFLKRNKVPFIKYIANYIGNLVTFVVYGLWVSDSQSGFRAYSKRALSLIDTKHDRYEFDSEVIREIARNKLKYTEVPIHVRYTQYSMSKLHKQNFVNGLKTLFRLVIST